MSSIIKGLQTEANNDFNVAVPGYGTVPLEMLKRHVKELTKDFNEMVQSEEFIKAAYRTEQLYNALFALSKAMKAKSMEEGYAAGITGGAGLGIEKSPIEKVIEKPLGETIQSSQGGMGQSYRKFTPKSAGTSERLDELSPETLAKYKKAAGADASKADKEGDFERGNKRFSGIVRATKKEFDQDAKKVKEEQAPMFTPEENLSELKQDTIDDYISRKSALARGGLPEPSKKFGNVKAPAWKVAAGKIAKPGSEMEKYAKVKATLEDEAKIVNANDPRSDGWRVYDAVPAGTKESSIMKGLQNEVKGNGPFERK
jgi:hypothetical protein